MPEKKVPFTADLINAIKKENPTPFYIYDKNAIVENARAFLKDAPILVLDEATSALDSETEIAIQRAFDDLARGRTTIAIAHRLSTLRNMDKIVVLDHGQIIEQGTHNQLIRRHGEYSRLWKMQSGGFLQE